MTRFCVSTVFQSTPSAWRETQDKPIAVNNLIISIHSLRMEGDLIRTLDYCYQDKNFNPLPPHGGRL